jgi:hypothetical protein
LSTTAPTRRRSPVRVKLARIDAERAMPYPPAEAREEWWERLKAALGTCSSAFVQAALAHFIAVCRLPGTGVSEVAVNAALAFIEGAKPRDEVEAALIVQMAATHSAAMAVLGRIGGAYGGERTLTTGANAAGRLLRAFAIQVETLRRLRNGGSQLVRVEHV